MCEDAYKVPLSNPLRDSHTDDDDGGPDRWEITLFSVHHMSINVSAHDPLGESPRIITEFISLLSPHTRCAYTYALNGAFYRQLRDDRETERGLCFRL